MLPEYQTKKSACLLNIQWNKIIHIGSCFNTLVKENQTILHDQNSNINDPCFLISLTNFLISYFCKPNWLLNTAQKAKHKFWKLFIHKNWSTHQSWFSLSNLISNNAFNSSLFKLPRKQILPTLELRKKSSQLESKLQ